MKATLVIFLCFHRVYGYQDTIEVKDSQAKGITKGDIMLQRLSTPAVNVNQVFWWEDKDVLYYTDLMSDELLKWSADNGAVTKLYVFDIGGEYFEFFIPFKNKEDQGLIGSDNMFRVLTMNLDDEQRKFNVTDPVFTIDEKGYNIHTAHSDKNGVLYVIAKHRLTNFMDKKGSILYKIKKKELTKAFQFDTTVDDFVFSFDYKKMFLVSHDGTVIDSYDFDIDAGKISNQETVFNATANKLSWKMTSIEFDNEDQFWVAADKYVLVINKDGKLVKVVETPMQLTSITFGAWKNANLMLGTKKLCDYGNQQAGSIMAISGLNSHGKPDELMVW